MNGISVVLKQFAAVLTALALLVSVNGPAFAASSRSMRQYDPNPPAADIQKTPLRIVVLPFDDQRSRSVATRVSKFNGPDIESKTWSSISADEDPNGISDVEAKTLYAQWLAAELQNSGLFSEARFGDWKELAEGEPPHLAVAVSIRANGVVEHWWYPMFLLLIVALITPDGTSEFKADFNVEVFNPDDPHKPLWSRAFTRSTPRSVWFAFTEGKVATRLVAGQKDLIRLLYKDIRDALAQELKPGGALYAQIH